MRAILYYALFAYFVALIGRMLLSWFPLQPGTVMDRVNSGLRRVTDPVLEPLRKVVPRLGMFDLTPMIVIFVLSILMRAVGPP